MSKQVDEKVVSMQFDNAQFEKNVSHTMSTVDKLKQKLHFKDSAKGLENVSSAAKNVNMSGLGSAVDNVRSKFSAMEVIGVTALANITNSAVNAGKRIVSALTIDPIKTGFKEYETQINAVQTILANTESKGTTIDDVNEALDILNTYADKTIYNFTEMTRNIGTFTAAGVDLDTSVNAIQGIANLAAVSGSTSQQASTAMYQLSQALASGTVKLMDWNSVVNAGMGGEVFQNALKETARVHGVAIDDMIDKNGSFRETLREDWLTSEILTETLGKFTMATEGVTEAEIEANRAKLKSLGYTDQQIEGIFKLGNTATNAATKVKTFTQLWDVMKESAQSGWSKTWKLIIGDFEGAKNLLTPLADFFTGIINKMADWRNNLLEGALGKSFKGLSEKIAGITKPFEKASEAITSAKNSLKDLGKIVDEVIIGKWKNGEDRYNALTEAGYNYYSVQNKVNEKLGDSFRYTNDVIESQDKLLGSQDKTTKSTSEASKTTKELTDAEIKNIVTLAELSEAELKAKGYTDDQIEAFKELKSISEKLGIPMEDLIANLDEINGRWLLLNAVKNIGKGIVKVFQSIRDAWREIFPPKTSDGLFNAIAGFHRLSTKMVMSDESADKLKRTFKGLFAILKLLFTLVSGPFKIAFKILSAVLDYFDLDLLTVTAYIGDAIVQFCDWIDRVVDFNKIIDKVLPSILAFGKGIFEWIGGIKDAENIPKYIFEGLINGLKSAFSGVWNVLSGLVTGIIDYVKNLLGIHSPSTVFIAIGGFIVAGLVMGLTGSFPDVLDFFQGMGDKISGVLKGIDWGKVIAALVSVGMVVGLLKLGTALSKLASPFESFGEVLTSVSGGIKSFSLAMKAEAIKSIAISIAILVGAIAILTLLDTAKTFIAIGAIVILLGALAGMLILIQNMGKDGNAKIAKFSVLLMALSAAMFVLSMVVKRLGKMSWEALAKAGVGLGGLAIIIVGLVAATRLAGDKTYDKIGKMLTKLSVAMLIMVIVAKMIAGMSWDDMAKAGAGIGGLSAIIVGLVAATKLAGDKTYDKIGKMLTKLSVAMLMMVLVAKIIIGMSWDEMAKAGAGIGGLGVIITGLIAATRLAGGRNIDKIGKTISKIGMAMLLLALVGKIIAGMSWEDMAKAGVGITGLGAIITGLIAATKLAGNGRKMDKVGKTLLLISVAIGVLAAVSILLSLMSWEGLAKGVAATGALSAMMAGLIAVTKLSKNCEKTVFALAVSIAILAAAVITLSFVDVNSLIASTTAIAAILAMLALTIVSTKFSDDAMKTLLGISAAMAVIGTILIILSRQPVEGVLVSAAALATLMGTLAGIMVILSKTKKVPTSSIGALALMGLVVGELAAILAVLSMLNAEPSIETAASLSILLGALVAMTLVLSKIKKVPTSSIGALALMGLVVGELAAILALLSLVDVNPSIETATALSILLASLTGCLIILSGVGTLGAAAFTGIGALAALIGAVGGIMVAIGALVELVPGLESFLDTGMAVLEKIGYAIGSFFGNIVGGLLAGITSGLPDIGSDLSAFMTNAKPFIDGAKNIDATTMEGVRSLAGTILILTGASLLESITSWLTGGSSLTKFGEQIIPFGKAMVEFSDIVSGKIDTKAVTSAANAGKIMAEMADTLPNSGGVFGFFTGENDMDDFGAMLEPFGKAMVKFSKIVAGNIDNEAVEAAANAGKTMAEMADTLPNSGGVVGFFTGENDMDVFGQQLVPFGKSMVAFSDVVAGNIDPLAVGAASSAGLMMSKMADTIPNSGGVVEFFTGGNDIDDFGEKLVPFGESMVAFSATITGKIDPLATTAAATAGLILAKMNDSLPTEGGVFSWFTGETMDMNDFSDNLKPFGTAMAAFSKAVSGNIDEGAVTAASNAGSVLAKMNADLPTEGGVFSWFTGNKISFSDFGKNIKSFGTAMKDFSAAVSGNIDEGAVTAASNAGSMLAKMNKDLPTEGGVFSWFTGNQVTLADFGKNIKSFGTAIKDFSTQVSGIKNPENLTKLSGNVYALFEDYKNLVEIVYENDLADGYYDFAITDILNEYAAGLQTFDSKFKNINITSVDQKYDMFQTLLTDYMGLYSNHSKIDTLNNSVKTMATVLSELAELPVLNDAEITTTLTELGRVNIADLLKIYSDAKIKVKVAGQDIMLEFSAGIKSKTDASKAKCTDLVTACVEAINKKKDSFKSAGKSLVDGFASGITEQTFKAEAKAKAMAEAAEKAAKEALDINSPSKVFRSIGMSVPEGFAMGIDKLSGIVQQSSVSMASGAVDKVRNTIAHIGDMFNSDIDSQPTIRPVVDLSEVRAGTSAISHMFNMDSSIGVRANVGFINSMMNDRIQNGDNSDIVSAIEDLGRKLNNMSGDTYSINGVTYDDGSNINSAVKTIVQAARIARRV